jgi:hypothetical protein
VVLQGIDTAGKDGTIRHVFKETGPARRRGHRFPQAERGELAHDFLWRAHMATPRRGVIGIFNRSHYEDVLVGLVRKLAPRTRSRRATTRSMPSRKSWRERHHNPQVHAAHLQEGAARTLAGAARRAAEPLEVQPVDLDDRKLWTSSWRPTS